MDGAWCCCVDLAELACKRTRDDLSPTANIPPFPLSVYVTVSRDGNPTRRAVDDERLLPLAFALYLVLSSYLLDVAVPDVVT